ncbi:MAG: hypothetical protein ACK4F6_06950 [Hylemonella sp.]
MNNEHHTPQLPELKPVFRIKRTEVWDLAREALHQASPDGVFTNYPQAMSLLLHAAAFVTELSVVNAQDVEEIDLVENCIDLNQIKVNRLLDSIGAADAVKRSMLAD